MLIGFAIVAVILLGSAGFHFLKGSIIKSFSMLISAMLAAFFALGFFEILSGLLIGYCIDRVESLIPYIQAISFLLIFALTFSIMQVLIVHLIFYEVNLGKAAETTGKIILGILNGYILAGVLLTFLALLPLSEKYPYPRFDENNPNPDKPKKVFLNPDGFITSLFGRISSGSFSAFGAKASFAALHPNFIDQLYLNKLVKSQNLNITSAGNEITVPSSNGAWNAGKDLKDTDGRAVEAKSGSNLVIVRAAIKRLASYNSDVSFASSQVRLLCGQKKDSQKILVGRGRNIYPIGYLKSAQIVQKVKLTEKIKLDRGELNDNVGDGSGKWFDFVFEVPNNMVPFAIEFRQNSIAAVPPPVSAEKALSIVASVASIPLSQCAQDFADVQPLSESIYGVVLTAQNRLLEDLPLSIPNEGEWDKLQTDSSVAKAQFSDGKITFVRAELKITGPAAAATAKAINNISTVLKLMDGYNLLALKCNSPAKGAAISPQQLPVLVESSGSVHHPVGIVASGMSGEDKIYQIEYCSLTADKISGGLTIGSNGAVEQTFVTNIWIGEKTESIQDFYCLYLVKPAEDVFITSVKPAGAAKGAGFVNFQAFIVR